MTNLDKYIEYLETQVRNHSIYVFGAQGEGYPKITKKWIRSMETTEKNAELAIEYWEEQCALGYEKVLKAFDCSGLGMYELDILFGYEDRTADDMYNTLCDPISKSQLKRGDWVFKANSSGKKTHVGYIVNERLDVIESKGRRYGVTKSPLADSWNAFGRPKCFKKEIEGEDIKIMTRVLRVGCKGDDVKRMQARLIELGISCGKWGTDGDFGNATRNAVIQFQKKYWPHTPSEWDGIAGRKTLTALGFVCVW